MGRKGRLLRALEKKGSSSVVGKANACLRDNELVLKVGELKDLRVLVFVAGQKEDFALWIWVAGS